MPQTISAEFETRREAEMTVEHLVQEHGLDPARISIMPASADNSAGARIDGSDRENNGDKAGTEPHPALAGRLKVSVEADDGVADKVMRSFASFGGKR